MNCASILNYPKLNNLGNLVGSVYFAYLPIILYHPVDSVSGQNFPPPVFWRLLRISVDHHLLRSECHSSLGLAQVGQLSIHTNNVKMWEFVWHFVITSSLRNHQCNTFATSFLSPRFASELRQAAPDPLVSVRRPRKKVSFTPLQCPSPSMS